MEDIKRGESSLASSLACIEESFSERIEGLNSISKYEKFGKKLEFNICMGLVMQN